MHTATPWRVTEEGYLNAPMNSAGGHAVPLCSPFTHKAHRDKHGGANQEARDNAELIARAVNAHARVVATTQAAAALLAKIDNITSEDFATGGDRVEREALRAALAAVEN